ncbi:DNA-binding NarL/FixJ family response regulator [Enterobacillus tribolii]|uniref:DNA-binding NarL/FixJ family response regulator n=1 Tax=Enterobacillus tribolii TaxID=1487935 RepID=A0A370QSL7_9GAMM|nr:hypothetical protein [Enterobacillus tribolii]RDK92171.1 DNA-binding NarL/FixJ family response regulator [Enterobacillus tribolii]
MARGVSVPDLVQFGYCSRRILVQESADITWLGLYSLVEQSGMRGLSLMRVPELDKLTEMVNSHSPDVLLLSSVGRKVEILPLLHQLSDIMTYHPLLHIVVLLKQEMPHLSSLLYGFGVATIFSQPPSMKALTDQLGASPSRLVRKKARPLTPQERNVAKSLLMGYSVSRLARVSGKNVRTVSTQKQSVIQKLNMNNPGELQVLGGRLMATE